MKRTMALFSVVAASALLLAGCSGEKGRTSDEGITLTYWGALPSNAATHVSSLNEVLMYQQREADSGIHIEFIHPSQGQDAEQFNLMIASQDLPDMIEYDWTKYTGGAQSAIDDGMIISLNNYLDKYAPNFKAVLSEDTELAVAHDRGSKTDECNYYGFPNLNIGSARVFGGPMIRKDWLDDLGLEIPETIDDWTTVLRAFKEKKGASSPFSAMADYFKDGAFGVGQRFYLDGNIVKFGPLESGYKDYLALLHSWYQEGLLDKDFSTNQRKMVDSKMTKGDSGATFNTLGAGMGVYLKQMQTQEPNYNLIGIDYPVLNKGDVNNFCIAEGDLDGRSLAITTSCKNPEAAIGWADYWYSHDGYMLLNFGVERKTYNLVDGKPVYTDDILKNPNGYSVSEALGVNCRAAQSAPGMRQAPEYLDQYYEFPQQTALSCGRNMQTACVLSRHRIH